MSSSSRQQVGYVATFTVEEFQQNDKKYCQNDQLKGRLGVQLLK